MSFTGLLHEKFIKFVTVASVELDDMRIPEAFTNKFGEAITPNVMLNLRTGYSIEGSFQIESRRMTGLSSFYNDFAIKGGEILVFEYNGNNIFQVHILGTDYVQIQYPRIVHGSQNSCPREVTMSNGGFKCMIYLPVPDNDIDSLDVPVQFVDRYCSSLNNVTFVLSNGVTFPGYCDNYNARFHGLARLFQFYRTFNDRPHCFILMSYEKNETIHLSVFDNRFMKKIFLGNPFSTVPNGLCPHVSIKFEILIQASHMNQYCSGVDVPARYRNLSRMWGKKDYLCVFHEYRAWRLEIRHLRGSDRTTISGGWLQLRDDLQLGSGDVCSFESPEGTCRNFLVVVVRAH